VAGSEREPGLLGPRLADLSSVLMVSVDEAVPPAVSVTAAGLMDEQDLDDERTIQGILDAHVAGQKEPRVCSYHKVRHRHSGRERAADDARLHVYPGDCTSAR